MKNGPLYSSTQVLAMEWWRGFLSLLVFLTHVIQIFLYPLGFMPFWNTTLANFTVVIFFLLSGMLITYSAMNLYRENNFNYKQFFINRVARIYPSLLAMVVLCIGLSWGYALLTGGTGILHLPADQVVRDSFSITWKQVVQTILMVHPGLKTSINGPLWSLYLEWWLYVAAGLFFVGMYNKKGLMRYGFYGASLVPLLFAAYNYGERAYAYYVVWIIGALYSLYIAKLKQGGLVVGIIGGLCLVLYSVIFGYKNLLIDNAAWQVWSIFQDRAHFFIFLAYSSILALRFHYE